MTTYSQGNKQSSNAGSETNDGRKPSGVPSNSQQQQHGLTPDQLMQLPAEGYLRRPAVLAAGLEVARKVFNDFPIEQYKPDNNTLAKAKVDQGDILATLRDFKELLHQSIRQGAPLEVQTSRRLKDISQLGFKSGGSFQEQLELMESCVPMGATRSFRGDQLELGYSSPSNRQKLLLKVPFEPSIHSSTPWSFAAREAFEKVLSLAMGAAIVEHELPYYLRHEKIIEFLLREKTADVIADPTSVSRGKFIDRARIIRDIPGIELLVDTNPGRLLDMLKQDSFERRFRQMATEKVAEVTRHRAKETALEVKESELKEQWGLEPGTFLMMAADLQSALKESTKYGSLPLLDRKEHALNLLAELVKMKDFARRLETAVSWGRQLRNGAKLSDLLKSKS
jgi:hypothetical protein